ncbi:hypothetical protein B0H14DRAFT_3856880 [Mycena olivaceomarginata]|nr:hypothetical protein B0H14DRAFT_3856880 [Mycena olivaceomarginata]
MSILLSSSSARTLFLTPSMLESLRWSTLPLHFPQRTSYESLSAFARIRCPITLVYGSEDIVYPLSFAEDLLSLLRTANVNASLHILEGAPHFANITHQNETHTLLYDFILANSSAADIPPAPTSVQSPFEVELGLCDDTADDSDSDTSVH